MSYEQIIREALRSEQPEMSDRDINFLADLNALYEQNHADKAQRKINQKREHVRSRYCEY